jgi:hypothetical protein
MIRENPNLRRSLNARAIALTNKLNPRNPLSITSHNNFLAQTGDIVINLTP